MGIACTTYVLTLKDGPVPIILLRPGIYIYSWTGERVSVGRVEALGEPCFSRRLLRIVLAQGSSVRVTRDHVFRTFDRGKVMACDIKDGDRLLPLHLKKNDHGYFEFQQLRLDRSEAPETTDQRRYRSVARMVACWKLGVTHLAPRTICRHIDQDRSNCCPENIEVEETPSDEVVYRRNLVAWSQDILGAERFVKENKKLAQDYKFKTPRDLKNHRVVGVHETDGDQVVDIVLEHREPYVIGNETGGIFVG